ncbi:MAG: hypothetical protein GY810_03045 [Aureispira sp.]|nr:hypothetical protein [Aureispira sp.]
MAIKNKVKPEQYTEDAAKSITADKMKAESHSAVKMLIKKGYDVKTSFFLKAGHFKGDKIKYKGMFLAIGDSPALLKKFKKEKTDPSVAYGNLFIKQEKGEDIVHFEYVSGQGKLKKPADWKALFKEIKKMVKKKCAFVVDGQTVETKEEEAPSSSPSPTSTPEVSAPKVTKEDIQKHVGAVKGLVQKFTALKSNFDTDQAEELDNAIDDWNDQLDEFGDAVKSKVGKAVDTIKQIKDTLTKLSKHDDVVIKKLEKVYDRMEQWLELEDHTSVEAVLLEKVIKKKAEKAKVLAAKINDKGVLEELDGLLKELKE